ncbi:MAG: DUF433 domain-containing protein [Symploca sp. SIO3E6]|nr:DUF433 domain-containing protein [Caldora sp. SIO3E6]
MNIISEAYSKKMSEQQVIIATYENGTLKPDRPLNLRDRQTVKIRLASEHETRHPYITKTPGICGGKAVIQGTRIPVSILIGHYHNQETPEEILAGFPQLSLAQFYAALSYYYENQSEIDCDREREGLIQICERFNLKIQANGKLSSQE